ncbi:MAG: hypothetical protein ACXU82_06785 [Caulobacteraceae bacterium]
MPGYTKDENSLATGIPDRTVGPETGSFGNAVKTNAGDTSQGTNQDHESSPPPAAGIGASALTTDDLGERRSFGSDTDSVDTGLPSDVEPVYQQIADGGDRFDPDKRLDDRDEIEEDEVSDEDRIDGPKAPFI